MDLLVAMTKVGGAFTMVFGLVMIFFTFSSLEGYRPLMDFAAGPIPLLLGPAFLLLGLCCVLADVQGLFAVLLFPAIWLIDRIFFR
ncbi:MAG: hypothetical protein K2X27_18125 [Candidatus Obscuribacterales bacterium]|nr:hypothetical protein [Candidatus Obscuribacterales bacterium]